MDSRRIAAHAPMWVAVVGVSFSACLGLAALAEAKWGSVSALLGGTPRIVTSHHYAEGPPLMLGLFLGAAALVALAMALSAFDEIELDPERRRLERRFFERLVSTHDLDELVSVEELRAHSPGADLLGKAWLVRFWSPERGWSKLRLTPLHGGSQAIVDALCEELTAKRAGTTRASRTP